MLYASQKSHFKALWISFLHALFELWVGIGFGFQALGPSMASHDQTDP